MSFDKTEDAITNTGVARASDPSTKCDQMADMPSDRLSDKIEVALLKQALIEAEASMLRTFVKSNLYGYQIFK